MAYQETTGNSPDDVINKIATFAAAAGWTVIDNILAGSNRTLVLKKSGDYIQVWNTTATDIFVTGYIGYVPGTAHNLQSGYAGSTAQTNLGAGPYTNVFMFSESLPSDHVHVVIETAGGIFKHLSFGGLAKLGAWTGGTYFDASYWATAISQGYVWQPSSSGLFDTDRRSLAVTSRGAIRCDIPADGQANTWATMYWSTAFHVLTGLSAGSALQIDGRTRLTEQFYKRNAPPFSGQIALGTIRADVTRPGGFYSPLGSFPNIRYLDMARFAPGQEITIGSDTWKVFPMIRKGAGVFNTPGGTPYSDNHGYAFKKVA